MHAAADPTSFPCQVRRLSLKGNVRFQQNPAVHAYSVELAKNVRCLFRSDEAGIQQNPVISANSVELAENMRCLRVL